MERYQELQKCCGEYPKIISRADGARKIVCKVCRKATPYILSTWLSANIKWNELIEEEEQ